MQLQPAYILHSRPYRETSVILELFTQDHGRIAAIARGVRGVKSRFRGTLQPFTPLLIHHYGKSELTTLTHVEQSSVIGTLAAQALFSGLYVNELLVRLLHHGDPHPEVYQQYEHLIQQLVDQSSYVGALRLFEKRLLQMLGYALCLTVEASGNQPIESDADYHYDPERGPIRVTTVNANTFSGSSLLALAEENLASPQALRDAKRLLRSAIGSILGEKRLRSREYFLQMSS